MADTRLVLAYDAVVDLLNKQDSTLSNLRDRSSNVLTVAALITSFAAGIGLVNTDPDLGPVLPVWAGLGLLGILFLIGSLVMAILWPVTNWAYAISPHILLERIENDETEDDIRRATINVVLERLTANQRAINKRSLMYRITVGLLLFEIAVLVVILLAERGG